MEPQVITKNKKKTRNKDNQQTQNSNKHKKTTHNKYQQHNYSVKTIKPTNKKYQSIKSYKYTHTHKTQPNQTTHKQTK